MQRSVLITKDVLATNNKRLANYVVDVIAQYAISYSLVLVAEQLYVYFESDWLYNFLTNDGFLFNLLSGYGLLVVYYTIFETLTQRSLGKYITGTKVLVQDGSVPSAGTIALRSLCRVIPFEHFSFLGDKQGGWHDRFTSTVVVNVKEYEEVMLLKNSFEEIGKEQNYN